jgi:hypothetical protein
MPTDESWSSRLLTPALDRADEIRAFLRASGLEIREVPYLGLGSALAFQVALGPEARPAAPISMLEALAEVPRELALSPALRERLLGAWTVLAAELARALEIEVLLLHVSAEARSYALATWQGASQRELYLVAGGRALLWTTERGLSEIHAHPHGGEGQADALLSRSQGGLPGDKGKSEFEQDLVWSALSLVGISDKTVLLVLVLLLAGVVALGEALGERWGHGDAGALAAFYSVIGVGLILLWRRRPAGQKRGWDRASLTMLGLGLSLLGASRALGATDAAMWAGMAGFFLLVLGALRALYLALGMGE